MRGTTVGAGIALAVLLGAGTAGAQPAVLTAVGRCEFVINNGEVAAGTPCKRVTLTSDAQTGEGVLRLEFDTGLTFEIIGPALQLNPGWSFLTPSQVSWINPGGAPRQDLANRSDSERDEIAGRCAIAFQRKGGGLYEIYCDLKSPLGAIKLEFKAPKA